MASQDCWRLWIQISLLSPCYAFTYRTGTCETSFIFLKPPCSRFPVPKSYVLGRNLVVVMVARKWTRGLTVLHPLPPPRSREWSTEVGRRQGQLRGDNVYLRNNKDSSLAWASLTHKKPGKHPFSLKTSHTGINKCKGITSFKSNKCLQAYRLKER